MVAEQWSEVNDFFSHLYDCSGERIGMAGIK